MKAKQSILLVQREYVDGESRNLLVKDEKQIFYNDDNYQRYISYLVPNKKIYRRIFHKNGLTIYKSYKTKDTSYIINSNFLNRDREGRTIGYEFYITGCLSPLEAIKAAIHITNNWGFKINPEDVEAVKKIGLKTIWIWGIIILIIIIYLLIYAMEK